MKDWRRSSGKGTNSHTDILWHISAVRSFSLPRKRESRRPFFVSPRFQIGTNDGHIQIQWVTTGSSWCKSLAFSLRFHPSRTLRLGCLSNVQEWDERISRSRNIRSSHAEWRRFYTEAFDCLWWQGLKKKERSKGVVNSHFAMRIKRFVCDVVDEGGLKSITD